MTTFQVGETPIHENARVVLVDAVTCRAILVQLLIFYIAPLQASTQSHAM